VEDYYWCNRRVSGHFGRSTIPLYLPAIKTRISNCNFILDSNNCCNEFDISKAMMMMMMIIIIISTPVTSPEGPRGFQEVKVPRFRDNGTGWW